MQRQITFTCFLAGLLEVYDFTIFGYLADIIRRDYLSFVQGSHGLIITYALFAIGFIFRPLGSVIFGYIGDNYGRKVALTISIFLMSLCSLGMAFLPNYLTIGITACYLLVLIRILQGISIGGEYSGSIIFAVEHLRNQGAGLVGSIVVSGCMFGVVLATIVSNIIRLPYFPEWSWRVAFLLGFLLSLIGFYIRLKLTETPEFKLINKSKRNSISLVQGLKQWWPECLSTALIAATSGVNIYFVSIYLPKKIIDLPTESITWLSSLSTIIMACLIPLFGSLSDKFGRIRIMYIGSILLAISGFILVLGIYGTPSYKVGISLTILHAVTAAIFMGPMNTLVVEIFSPEARYSCSAFSYSIGMGFIGGTAPMIASIIDSHFSNKLYLALYLSTITLLGFLAINIIKYRENNFNIRSNERFR